MNRVLLAVILLNALFSCDTERNIPLPESTVFTKFYGADGEQTGVDLVVTPDNAIVMVGNSTLPGKLQMIYVVKVDFNGHVIWENMIGQADKNNTVKDIELHPDGRLIIAGETEMSVGNRDVFVKILNGSGAELDSIRYGLNRYVLQGDEEVNSISIITQGPAARLGYIVSGSTTDIPFNAAKPNDTKDGLILRFTDNPLNILPNPDWISKGEDDSEDIVVRAIQETANDYYFFGYTNTNRGGSRDFKYWVFSLNDGGGETNNGIELGAINEDEKLKVVLNVDTSDPFDRGFLLGGIAIDNAGNKRSYFVKLKRTLPFNEPSAPSPADALQVYGFPLGTDGSDKMGGFYNSFNNDFLILATQNLSLDLLQDFSLFKLNREVDTIWGPYAFGGESVDEAGNVIQLPDGTLYMVGTMTVGARNGLKKMALLKLNSEGKLWR
ncbi:MAG: hypothetical protein KF856_12950 [Cyclobacteriaceae bacterium]|nr:hypothetical protein [Cyclobacteriaceae bacterium]